jgi:hypothetical protein|tara:strand:+ start:1577 stop:2299 length:723 start_codon:yes stop_codon:yes gene_type:complete
LFSSASLKTPEDGRLEGVKMNKWIAIPIIGIMAVGLTITGVFYLQEANKLDDAQNAIANLQGDVSDLKGDLAAAERNLTIAEADLTASEVTSLTLKEELLDSTTRVTTLETELDEGNSAIQTQQSLNLTLSGELEKVQNPRHFETLDELEAWLAQDDTDTRVRWQSLPPEQKVFILQVRALRDGYLLPAWFEDFDFDNIIDFVGNLAYIGDEIYYVWPLDDSVAEFAFVPPIPSHPLSSE